MSQNNPVRITNITGDTIVHEYNHIRYHTAINYLTPWTYYRRDPEPILRERKTKLEQSRQHRKQQNIARSKTITKRVA